MIKILKIFFIIFVLFYSNVLLFSERYLLDENWYYSIEKENTHTPWEIINIKKSLKSQGIFLKKNDIIYYKTRINFQDVSKAISNNQSIGIYFGKIEGESKIFFNDKLLYTCLYDLQSIYFEIKNIDLPSDYDIIVKVKKNISKFSCSLSTIPYFDSYDNLRRNYLIVYFFQLFIILSILLIGTYFLLFFRIKLNNDELIYFFLFCLFVSIYSLIRSPFEYFLVYNFNFNYTVLEKIMFICSPIQLLLMLNFMIRLFKDKSNFLNIINRINLITTIILILLVIIVSLDFIHNNKIFFHIYLVLNIIIYFFVLIKYFNNKNYNLFYIIFGCILMAVFCIIEISDIWSITKVGEKFTFSTLGVFMLVFSIGMDLTRLFTKVNLSLRELTINLEQKVIERTKQVELMAEQKTNFFINLAHETKTPLSLISNYIEKYIKNKKLDNDLIIIKNNIDKMRRDIVNYFDMEKLLSGKDFYDNDNIINISNILEDKIKLFIKTANEKSIIIHKNIKKNLYIKIDPYAFDRIINNLLENAIKYTNKKDQIDINLCENDSNVILEVKDNGIGIDEKQLEHIFEPYYQIHHKKRNIQGIGLGLSIVKKIVDLVNGEIKVESKVNGGSKFTIIFEKCNLGLEKAEHKVILSKPHIISDIIVKDDVYTKGRYNILIVEDNIELLNFLEENISKKYNTFLALNGEDALKKISNIPKPNLIISDIMMDEMDGNTFYSELQKNSNYKYIPFIFLTAKTSKESRIESLSQGAIDYITKPFLIEELILKVDSIIKNQYQQIESIKDSIFDSIQDISNWDKDKGNVQHKKDFNEICKKHKLTDKEKDITKLLLNGLQYKEISNQLKISYDTVKKIIHNIYKKINVKNKVDLFNAFN